FTLFGVLQFMFNLKQFSISVATLVATVTASTVCPTTAQAASIDTASSWDGTNQVIPFGETNTATYGQTFTVGTDSILQKFSFWLGGYQSGSDGVDFAAYVMKWDGAKAVGSVLYESSQRLKSPTATFEEFSFNTGGISLTSGQQYVAFLSASKFFDGIEGLIGMGFTGDAYSGGNFVYYNNGSNFAALNSSIWDGSGYTSDAAFRASFTSDTTSIPTPALLPGLIGLGLGVLRKRKAQAQAVLEEKA
ncbi:MAG: PTPA-CTERM sorting domain-containing protein, partial [Phormidesmis sp. CAN_BIN36]|nr:PTPA-CTERM sorting domain-containing protein [Phormidesmis sp. CAN_BIN36]